MAATGNELVTISQVKQVNDRLTKQLALKQHTHEIADVLGLQAALDSKISTVTVGKTTTGEPGTNASVVNSGTAKDVVLDFTIPRGADGAGGSGGSTDEWHRYPFGVNKTITIGNDRTLVATVAFKVGSKDTVCDVHAQILLYITLPAKTTTDATTTYTPSILTCTWVLDGVEYKDFQPIETYATAGRHVLHLYLAPYATANTVHNLDLYMQCQAGSATIQSGWMMGMLEGNGLAGGSVWNGRFDIDDTFQRISTNSTMPLPVALNDNVDTALIAPIPSNVSDTFSRIDLNTITLQPPSIKDTPSLHPGTEAVDWLHADIESYDKTQGEWVGNIFQATKQATLTSWLMGTDQTIAGITNIAPVDAPDTAVYQLSWDGGTTWGAVDDHGTWTVDATMTGSRMAALDQAQYAAWYTPQTGLKARVTLQAGTTIRQILVTYKLTTGGFQS